MTYETELSRKLIRDLAGYQFPVCKLLGPVSRAVSPTSGSAVREAPVTATAAKSVEYPAKHRPNTESMRCSCKAPLCSNCGWCAATCGCYEGHALEVELRKRRIPDAREVDLERQSGCFDEE